VLSIAKEKTLVFELGEYCYVQTSKGSLRNQIKLGGVLLMVPDLRVHQSPVV
jgi:hypothetical protein